MTEKISTVTIILFILILILAFTGFVYLFVYRDGMIPSNISVHTNVLGVEIESAGDNNFNEPEDVTYIQDDLIPTEIENEITSSDKSKKTYQVDITKLNVINNVSRSNTLDELQDTGWMLLPWTYQDKYNWFERIFKSDNSKSEAIITCYRMFYGPTHQKSCYRLDELVEGDEIRFDEEIYIVKTVSVVSKNQKSIFSASDTREFLKIITNSGPNMEPQENSNYLIVIAEKSQEVSEGGDQE